MSNAGAATRNPHPAYVDVYRAVNGWQTKLMSWDDDGFYDVWQTGFGPHGHDREGYDRAVAEGRHWAESEGVEFREPPPFEPLKEGEPRDLLECLRQESAKAGRTLTVVDLDRGTTEEIQPPPRNEGG
jgi:hypothetical protein